MCMYTVDTTLAASLWPLRRIDDDRWPEAAALIPRHGTKEESLGYPYTECGGIFSPYVLIHSCQDNLLVNSNDNQTEDICCSVMSIAAQDLRENRNHNIGHVFDFDLTVEKFRTLFHMAKAHGVRSLVLGAIGCGAFKNPPSEVARAFDLLLQPHGEFHNQFDLIVFSIVYSESNLTAFEQVFSTQVALESIIVSSSV